MFEGADACGVGVLALSREVVESTNCILKKRYNGHRFRDRGGGARVRWDGKQWSSSKFGNGSF